MAKRQAEPTFSRPALAPGILAAIVLMAGVGFMDNSWFIAVHFVVTILAVIIGWFAIQAKQYWWLVALIPIIVLWNPVLPLPLAGDGWFAAQLIAAIPFVAAGVMIRVPVEPEDRHRR
ncbi:DUF6804 family protein [Mycetocola zhadangensis]|uniref:Uncharacterized protein n=1 Tax=Mycetocola zhadangensis TaxID=1164595 RepID=A0A3L7ISY9_9MICO|nr:DUF6804 family protein [Mycetocola zhadangensis]RLQ81354.1 hypothetical protein D9V28_13400 [Mycetocola zhadangensis]GGF02474.1 hypothetical protein GCM10011313_26940 [Mycetocola zhadangensis]